MSPKTTANPAPSPQQDFLRWSAHSERAKAIADYTEVLKDADQRSVAQVENFTGQVQKIYKSTLAVYVVTLIAVGLVFVISLVLILLPTVSDFQRTLGTISLPVSLIILLLLAYRTPLKPARQIVGEIIKMQIIYLGYLRQVNQVDIGFKQNFVSSEKFTPKQLQDTFAHTQEIIDKAMDDINLLLEDLG